MSQMGRGHRVQGEAAADAKPATRYEEAVGELRAAVEAGNPPDMRA